MSGFTIDDLAPAPYNPRRKMTEKEAAGLAKSLADFGDVAGITYNLRTKRLVCGHQRVARLRELGGQIVGDAIQIANGQRFGVRVVDWSEAEEKAANVTANNKHIGSEFDERLAPLLGELQGSLGDEAFSELALDDLQADLESLGSEGEGGDVEQDEVPEPPKTPVTKPGDVWTLGEHRLYCADMLTVKVTVPVVVTDPPYGISDAPKKGLRNRGKRIGEENSWHPPSNWDKEIKPEWVAATEKMAPIVLWFGQWRMREQVASMFASPLRAEIVWAKNCHVAPPTPVVSPRDERMWVFSEHGIKPCCHDTSVWDEAIIPTWSHKDHKNEKPVSLMARCLRLLTREGDSVADPFAGSGTTLIAAEQLGRKCHAIEIEPAYCDVIVERWETLTGGEAQKGSM